MTNEHHRYDHYLAEDFAQDSWFIQWVKAKDQNSRAFWDKWLVEHPEKNEVITEARSLVQLIHSQEKEPSQAQIERIWQQVEEGLENQPKVVIMNPTRQYGSWQKVAIVAAGLALFVISFLLLRDTTRIIRSEPGQQISYTLPDRSVVTLNAGSEIAFDASDWENQRRVRLVGEAFFEVEPGSRFQVVSEGGSVEVLGTSFNVYARNERLGVACYSGKVKVSATQGRAAQLLTPGSGIIVTEHEITSFSVDIQQKVEWRTGSFIYDNVPLSEVLEELERQYNLEVELHAEIQDKNYSGQFTNDDLTGALQMICLPMELTYELDSTTKKVIIRPE
ncbi:MAG: FecR domain-containing protein [Bacteroidota bacterium]